MEKIITMTLFRNLEAQVNNEEITLSKMVGLLNDRAEAKVDEWKRYAEDSIEHVILYQKRMPNRDDYDYEHGGESYRKVYDDWLMSKSMTTPNKPGYFRANND